MNEIGLTSSTPLITNPTQCIKCPNSQSTVINSSVQSVSSDTTVYQLVIKVEDLSKKYETLSKTQISSKDFLGSVQKLSTVSRIAIIFLVIIPVLQAIICGVIIRALGLQENLPYLLYWGLSIVGGLSLLEVITYFVKVNDIIKRIGKLEDNQKATK